MLATPYLSYPFALVENLNAFYMTSDKLPEVTKVHGIIDASRLLFKLSTRRIKLYVAQGMRAYRIELYSPQGISKSPIGWIVYLPQERQLDLYDAFNPDSPVIQWKNKRVAWTGYSQLFQFAQIDKVFQGIVLAS